jgi:hypothetical protein
MFLMMTHINKKFYLKTIKFTVGHTVIFYVGIDH